MEGRRGTHSRAEQPCRHQRVRRVERSRSGISRTKALLLRVAGCLLAVSVLAPAVGRVVPASAAFGSDPITTIAGTGVAAFFGDGFSATQALLKFPIGVAVDGAGNLYIADYQDNRVRKVDTSGIITTVAGNGTPTTSGDGGPAVQAGVQSPNGVAVDASGNLYISMSSGANTFRVRKVDAATGIITTVAGNGGFGYSGDGGPATQASVFPCGVALDAAGDLYIADCLFSVVRKVDTSGIITTVAGNGTAGYSGDGGPATQAQFNNPNGIAADGAGNLYIADQGNSVVRKVDTSGVITTFAGTGVGGYSGDGGPATQAQLYSPINVAVDGSGNLYIDDIQNSDVRKVDTTGTISTVAGNGTPGFSGDFGPAGQAEIEPWGVAADAAGAVYIADGPDNRRVRRVGPERLFLAESHTPNPAVQGTQVTYTFTTTNVASSASTGVTLADALPQGVAFVAASPGCFKQKATVICNEGSIASGASTTTSITVQPEVTGTLRNKATVSSLEPDPYPPTNTVGSPLVVSARGCGHVITRNTVLGTDVGPCAANGIVIGADNVTLDLRGHRIYGFPSPTSPAGDAAGVLLPGRTGVTVKNGTVTQFDAGVVVTGGASNTLTGLTLTNNVGPDDPFHSLYGDGVFIQHGSSNNQIVGNTITHNGIFDGIGIYDAQSNSNLIQNNTIQDTVGPSDRGPAGQGIIINGATGFGTATSIASSRVLDNTVQNNASAGIANINEIRGTIEDNTVTGNGATNSIGNGIGVSVGFNWSLGPTSILIEGNQVHGNGVDGIRIGSPFERPSASPSGNTILNNNAANNATNPAADPYEGGTQGFDLHDLYRGGTCDSDNWSGNIWGSGGFNPVCTTVGGSGPTAVTATAPAVAIASPRVLAAAEQRITSAWQEFLDSGR